MKPDIIFAGNWKMHKTIPQALQLSTELKRGLLDIEGCKIIICPPYTALSDVKDSILDTNIYLGAQNIFWEEEGAYTGEISALMLKDAGCSYVIIGHSERRKYFKEDNPTINKKIGLALKNGLNPIFCIGETLEERKADKTFDLIQAQLLGGLKNISPDDVSKVTVAYEPVWAIGTGVNATAQQAQEVHSFIRDKISTVYSPDIAESISILYGGSVKPDNIAGLMSQKDIDGVLVGGASLKAESFLEIIKKGLDSKVKGR